jgi:hypothetical protein
VIKRSLAKVFAYMDDVTREHEWQPNIREAYKSPPGPTGVGTEKTYVSEFMGRSVRNTYLTTMFEPNVRVRYEAAENSIVQGRADFMWEEAEGGTQVTLTFDGMPAGILRFVPERIMAPLYQQELEESLERLKRVLEEEGR